MRLRLDLGYEGPPFPVGKGSVQAELGWTLSEFLGASRMQGGESQAKEGGG